MGMSRAHGHLTHTCMPKREDLQRGSSVPAARASSACSGGPCGRLLVWVREKRGKQVDHARQIYRAESINANEESVCGNKYRLAK